VVASAENNQARALSEEERRLGLGITHIHTPSSHIDRESLPMASQGVASMFALAMLLGAFASIPQSDSPFFILLSSSLSPSHDWVEYFYANFIFFDKGSFY
jgi:hypothetical protein